MTLGLREYLVSPLLVLNVPSGQFLRRKHELEAKREGKPYSADHLDWWSMRAHKLPDSALSGAISGGFLNAWKSMYNHAFLVFCEGSPYPIGGRAGIPTGMTTGALLCTLLQLAYNELGVSRLKYISQKLRTPPVETKDQAIPSIPQPASVVVSSTLPSEPPSEPIPWTERIFTAFGLQKVTDEEYLARLVRERNAHLRRIAELEREAEESKSNSIDSST